jgi:hypothetical protein
MLEQRNIRFAGGPSDCIAVKPARGGHFNFLNVDDPG